jgi:general secretion pathway protein J
VLIALAVFGLLLAGLTQGVRYGLQARRAQARISANHDDMDATGRALRHMIERMDPGDGVDPAPIAASRDRLEFITVLPDGPDIPAARRVEATLLLDRAHRLILRWRPYLHAWSLRPAPEPLTTELLSGVAQMELSYWRPARGWVTDWRFDDPPALVRVRLVFPPGDPRRWPDIVAAPGLNAP